MVSHTAALPVRKGLRALGVSVSLDTSEKNSFALPRIETISIGRVFRRFAVLTALISVKKP
jgi:hypothetical protein